MQKDVLVLKTKLSVQPYPADDQHKVTAKRVSLSLYALVLRIRALFLISGQTDLFV